MTGLPLFRDAEERRIRSRFGSTQPMRGDAIGWADAVRRSALWSAYGDALGWISELTDVNGLARRTANARLDRPIEWKRRIGGRAGVTATLPRGCYSDDTQLRLATGRAIQSYGFDVESFAKVELPIWLSYALGGGRSTTAAAANLARRRVQWYANEFKGWTDSGGNGAAMRIQPHVWAARDPNDPMSFILDVLRNSICTHSHPRGMLGASIHALALADTMTNRRYPSPDGLLSAASVAAKIPEIIGGVFEIGGQWRPAFEHESGTFEEAWSRAIEECQNAIVKAAETKGNGSERYSSIVDSLELRDPVRRGEGIRTAVAAVGLGWCEPQPALALSIAANAIGTDTDTIATMAGAMLGAVAEKEPPVEILDAELIRSEAGRLAEIAWGGKPEGHRYPDLLHWSAPKGRADVLVELEGRGLWMLGFGRAVAQGEPMPASQRNFSWQWVKLATGQTLFVKRRSKLAKAVEDRGMPPTRPPDQSHSADVYSKEIAVAPTVDGAQPNDVPTQTASEGQPRQSKATVDIETMLDYLDRHNYDDLLVGQALRRAVNKCTPSQLAAFSSVLFERLRELPSQPAKQRR